LKKLSSADTRSSLSTSASAFARIVSVSPRGATNLAAPTENRGPLGAGSFLWSALLETVIGMIGRCSR
jgi:hypothetical protein